MLIERVALGQVDYVYAHFGPLEPVAHSKVKPLEISSRVSVRTKEDVIRFLELSFDYNINVAALEICVKHEKLVLLVSWYLFVGLKAERVHASELFRIIAASRNIFASKDLLQQSFVIKPPALVVFRKSKFITDSSVL